jgi:galactose mutarotase-like enzyme
MATQFSVAGTEVFFLDSATLDDVTKNVRGGNPVLFPAPGKLVDDRWARSIAGSTLTGQLKQHGFARVLPWVVERRSTEDAASVTLRLSSSNDTLAAFPWPFEAHLTYRLVGDVLRIEQRVLALDGGAHGAMPFGFGFHPYFLVPDALKASASFVTKATRAFDNVTKSHIDVGVIDFAGHEVDLHLLDHGSSSGSLTWDNGRAGIQVRAHSDYSHWVLWTLPGRDFVCVEPWTCPGDALNSGDRLLWLEPGEARELWVEISPTRSP